MRRCTPPSAAGAIESATSLRRLSAIPLNGSAHEPLQVILRSALELAGQLGLVTVAEGVETAEDWHLLQQFGCTFAQGWLIAKPMSAAEFLPWLKTYRARTSDST